MSQAFGNATAINLGRGGAYDDPTKFTIRGIVYVSALALANRVISKVATGQGWNLRLPDALGNLELRWNRATTNYQYITNDTPFATPGWYAFVITANQAGPSHIYTAILSNGTGVSAEGLFRERTYGTATLGSGSFFSDAGADLVIGNAGGNNAVNGFYLCMAFHAGQEDTLADANAWLDLPRGPAAGPSTYFGYLGTAPTIVTRSVGSAGGRTMAHVTAIQSGYLNGASLPSANELWIFDCYDDSVFDFTAAFVADGYVADPWMLRNPYPNGVVIRAAAGQIANYPTLNAGVRWRRTTAPAASEYFWSFERPGVWLDGICGLYTGGAVAADGTQARGFRLNFGCMAGSWMTRCMLPSLNTTRPAASVVGISNPGGSTFMSLVEECGVGQDGVNSRCLSSAPKGNGVAMVGNSVGRSSGDQIRSAPSPGCTAYLRNNVAMRGAGVNACIFFDTGAGGGWDSDYNVTDDATADDGGGTHNQIAVSGQFVSLPGDLNLVSGSVARRAAQALAAQFPAQAFLGLSVLRDVYGRDAGTLAAPDIGAIQYMATSRPELTRRGQTSRRRRVA